MAYKHGIYNIEQPTSMPTPKEGRAAVQVIIGTAPIHLAKDPSAAVNKPVLCNSYKEAADAFGYSDDFDSFTLCQSIQASFGIFNIAPVILINVLDPANTAHVTENAAESCTVSNKTTRSQLSTILEKPSANWTIGNAIALTAALDIPIAEMRETIRK